MINQKRKIIFILFLPCMLFSQTNDTLTLQRILDEVNVKSVRANEKTPISFTNIDLESINKKNLGQDLPFIISHTPSIVTTSDAGAGVGYTSLRIRGSDPTRINVTINGIPLNDSESQGVWWVNMPDFISSVENIQIQRGVGTSTNGSSAFGASINLKTIGITKEPYFVTNNTIGSYSTLKNNFEFGTGILNNSFVFDGRLSKIKSDGYIDRASSDLKSLFLQGVYFSDNSALKGIIMSGNERTYQAWNGVPFNFLDTNRTYNSYTYKNEVDDYTQDHYQLHYTRQIKNDNSFNFGLHYTHGEGYYEQEKLDEQLSDYGLNDIYLGDTTITHTDLVRRKWLNNDFGGAIFSFNQKTNYLNLNIGGSINKYSGQHYGNIIWTEYASNSFIDFQYYWNKAEKFDRSTYAKANYFFNDQTNFYIDLQNRKITYSFKGYDNNGNNAQQEIALDFFNPKLGLFRSLSNKQSIYISYAIANKEPNRNDYVESTPSSRPKHETLFNTEIGYKIHKERYLVTANFYHMKYKDQLVLTGQINDVGAYTRKNVERSYRQGVEIEAAYKITSKLNINGNLTISENKINELVEYVDNWDTGNQEILTYSNTDLSFSPKLIWSTQISCQLNKQTNISFTSKFVGEQFIDNTSSRERMLQEYLVNNLLITYIWKNNLFKNSKISLKINNVLNEEYVSNAWAYRFISDGWDPRSSDPYINKHDDGYTMAGYFPQATRNYLIAISLGL